MTANLALTDEDRAAIKQILLAYKADGVVRPLLPADADLDGDGTVDSFGLDDNDEVIVVSGALLTETVFKSDGDDIKFEE